MVSAFGLMFSISPTRFWLVSVLVTRLLGTWLVTIR